MDQAQIDKIITGSRVYIKDAFGEGWGTVNKLDGDEFWIAVDGRGGYGKYSAAAIIHVHEKTAGEQIASLTEQLAQRDAEIQRLREDLNNTVMLLRRASVKLPPCTLVLNINDYLSRKRLQGGILRDAALPAPAATKPCPACNGTGEGENSGVCHCGDPMDHSAWEAGHSPVEMAYPCDKCGGSGKAAPAATKEGERS